MALEGDCSSLHGTIGAVVAPASSGTRLANGQLGDVLTPGARGSCKIDNRGVISDRIAGPMPAASVLKLLHQLGIADWAMRLARLGVSEIEDLGCLSEEDLRCAGMSLTQCSQLLELAADATNAALSSSGPSAAAPRGAAHLDRALIDRCGPTHRWLQAESPPCGPHGKGGDCSTSITRASLSPAGDDKLEAATDRALQAAHQSLAAALERAPLLPDTAARSLEFAHVQLGAPCCTAPTVARALTACTRALACCPVGKQHAILSKAVMAIGELLVLKAQSMVPMGDRVALISALAEALDTSSAPPIILDRLLKSHRRLAAEGTVMALQPVDPL